MDPITIMMAALKAGTTLGAGFANSQIDKFQASLAGTNAQIAEAGAGIAAAKGALDYGRVAQASDAAVAGAGVHFAGAGLDPTYGSPLFSQMHSFLQGKGDEAIVAARTAATVAAAKAAQASAVGQQAGYQIKAGNDLESAFFGAGTALLSSDNKDAWSSLFKSGASGLSSFAASAIGAFGG